MNYFELAVFIILWAVGFALRLIRAIIVFTVIVFIDALVSLIPRE
jgi:hypothetical protein